MGPLQHQGKDESDLSSHVYKLEDWVGASAWLSVLILLAALLWYDWTVEHGILWVVPVRLPFDVLWVACFFPAFVL